MLVSMKPIVLACFAVMACGIGTGSAQAATVGFELTVNGSTDPVDVAPGDTVTVGIWAVVTDNTAHAGTGDEIDLGLALYEIDINTNNASVLSADSQWFADTPANDSDEWEATYFPPPFAFGNWGRGNDVGGSIMGHGAGQGTINAALGGHVVAVTHTLLSSGDFVAGDLGQTVLSLANPNANVVTSSTPGSYGVTDQVDFTLSDPVTVNVIPEPASAALLSAACFGLLGRRGRRGTVA